MPLGSVSRRRILAAVGGVGALYLGADSAGAVLGDPVELNQRTVNGTYAQQNEFTQAPPLIALSWREVVNGQVREDTTDDVAETGGVGLIVDEAVMPGDSGAVTMRAELLERDTETQDAELYLVYRLTETAENGINDPEREAGDTSPNDGELEDYAEVRVWIDDGLLGGDGELSTLPVIGDSPVASGTLAEVDTSQLDGNPSANTGGYQLSVDGETCLSPGATVYVSFEWEIPESVGNIIQGDSAVFQLGFDPRPCPGG
jgi:hypothetical protein